MFFFWHKKEYQQRIKDKLLNKNRRDLAERLLGKQIVKDVIAEQPFTKASKDKQKSGFAGKGKFGKKR